jgi:hypothetical protein
LWDIQSPAYKSRNARDQALKHISEEIKIIGFGPKEVAQKIKNIRTTYKEEVHKIMKSKMTGSSPDSIYKPKVPWFEMVDSFLSCRHKVPPTLSNIQDTDNGNITAERSTSRASNEEEDTIRQEKTTESEHYSQNNTRQECSPQGISAKRRGLNSLVPLLMYLRLWINLPKFGKLCQSRIILKLSLIFGLEA